MDPAPPVDETGEAGSGRVSGDALYRLARIAAKPWRRDRDHDDLIQSAVLASLEWPDDPSAALTVLRMRAVCVEELRRRNRHLGAKARSGVGTSAMLMPPDSMALDRGAARFSDPATAACFTDAVERLLALDPAIADIVHAVLGGWSKQAVAEAWGVTPSRVSQRLARLRGAGDFDPAVLR